MFPVVDEDLPFIIYFSLSYKIQGVCSKGAPYFIWPPQDITLLESTQNILLAYNVSFPPRGASLPKTTVWTVLFSRHCF